MYKALGMELSHELNIDFFPTEYHFCFEGMQTTVL